MNAPNPVQDGPQVPLAPLTDKTLESLANHNARVAVMHLLDRNVDLAVKRAEKSQAYHDALMGRVNARVAQYRQVS